MDTGHDERAEFRARNKVSARTGPDRRKSSAAKSNTRRQGSSSQRPSRSRETFSVRRLTPEAKQRRKDIDALVKVCDTDKPEMPEAHTTPIPVELDGLEAERVALIETMDELDVTRQELKSMKYAPANELSTYLYSIRCMVRKRLMLVNLRLSVTRAAQNNSPSNHLAPAFVRTARAGLAPEVYEDLMNQTVLGIAEADKQDDT